MAAPTRFEDIHVCTNLKGGFGILVQPSVGVSLAGSVWTCQIRAGAVPSAPLLSPTITQVLNEDGTLSLTFSWTRAQSTALACTSQDFARASTYLVDIECAFADAPTQPVVRFYGNLLVHPGGNTEG